jgi:superoxide dismutase, Cu-Zn family
MRRIVSVGLLVGASLVAGCKTGHKTQVASGAGPEPVSGTVEIQRNDIPSAEVRRRGEITDVTPNPFSGVIEAVAVVHPTSHASEVHGTVRFTQLDSGVRVVADIEGLSPTAKHGFHIHEFGDCTGDTKTVGGGHYNPDGEQHGGPEAAHRHAGDFGNLETDDKGHAHYERVLTGISVAGDHNPVLGRSVIIHEHADDLSTQPSGNAGERIGCGIIGIAKTPAK